LLLLLVASATAFALSAPRRASAGMMAVTESDNGREFTLARGDRLEISLPATSGTGYTWQVSRPLRKYISGRREITSV